MSAWMGEENRFISVRAWSSYLEQLLFVARLQAVQARVSSHTLMSFSHAQLQQNTTRLPSYRAGTQSSSRFSHTRQMPRICSACLLLG